MVTFGLLSLIYLHFAQDGGFARIVKANHLDTVLDVRLRVEQVRKKAVDSSHCYYYYYYCS